MVETKGIIHKLDHQLFIPANALKPKITEYNLIAVGSAHFGDLLS